MIQATRLGDLPDAARGSSSPERVRRPHDRGIVADRPTRHARWRGAGRMLARALKPAVVAAEASLEARHEERR
jgi:hypothetical protein